MLKKFWIIVLTSVAVSAAAEIQLNGLFTDNMVLQRDRQVPVWGMADPGSEVTLEFAGQKKTARADEAGAWTLHLDPMEASSAPQTLTIGTLASVSTLQVTNVLVGDVWLCGGQSNMAQTMDRYLVWDQVKDGFANTHLRLLKIKQGGVGSPEPTKTLVIDPFFKEAWQTCTPEFAAKFSATAGFFGTKLQRDTGVPIGLLYANRGGTQVNMWLPREVLEARPAHARFLDPSNQNWDASDNNPGAVRAPSHLYNGTIHPLAPFALRGVIWYQGESDARWPELYPRLFGDLAASWRELWGYEFPFLFVQLAPFDQVGWDLTGEAWAWLRDAQVRCLEEVPNSGMVVITDAGEAKDIHPQAKNIPGERLALLAASLDDPDVDADAPTFRRMKVRGGEAMLRFSNVSGGLEARRVALNTERGHLPGQGPNPNVAEELNGFTICGPDRVFVEAQAEIVSRGKVVVRSPEVEEPVAVRYAWANFPICNLYGGNGMPAVPFRTDAFPMPNLAGDRRGQPFEGIQPAWGKAMDPVPVDDGKFSAVDVDGLDAWVAEGTYLYFKTPGMDQPASAQVHIVYRDEGFGPILLKYDSTSPELYEGKVPGVWKPAGEIRRDDSGQWRVASFDLPDAGFSRRCNGGDLRVQSQSPLTVGSVHLELSDSPECASQAAGPNVLLIVSDDLNVDLACYGHPQVQTPNIDRLRKRAMVFERAYTQYPLCNPSRNSFLSGQYPGSNGCLSNGSHLRDTAPEVVTLPQLFKANGYRSITTGKIFHHKDPRSWSRISNVRTGGLLPVDREPAFYRGWADEGKTRGEGRMLADQTVPWFVWRSVTEGEEFLKDGRVARATVRRIDEIAEDDVPFFLAVGFHRPHDPYFAPKRFFDLYPLESLALPEAPDDASAIPDHAFYDVFKKAFETMGEQEKREAMRAYYAGISYMDEQLGLVMDHLQKKALLDDTVIVFMSDHGYQVGEKDYWNKGLLFERSCRSPLLISTPDMKHAGATCRRIVELVDLYPTLTELCGLDAPEGLDGTSLVPLLEKPDRSRREWAYTYCNADRSVRDPRFRYIVWKQGGHALFDHEKDPGEHYNLADDPEYGTVVERMRELIEKMPEPGRDQHTRPRQVLEPRNTQNMRNGEGL